MKVPYTSSFPSTAQVEAREAFRKWANEYLDSLLPSDWREYVRFWVISKGATVSCPSSYRHKLRAKTFRKVNAGQEFELTPAHVKKITEYIDEVKRLDAAEDKQASDLEALKQMVKPILDKYPEVSGIARSNGIECVYPITLLGGSTTILRSGQILPVFVQGISGSVTIQELRDHLAEWEPKAAKLQAIAEQIKSELPAEFFTEAK